MRRKGGFVYILASRRNGTLYVGVTNNVVRRMNEHRSGEGGSAFVKRYGVYRLVHVEWHDDIRDAIAQEKRLKRWRRAWKIELIESRNPTWRDLYDEVCDTWWDL